MANKNKYLLLALLIVSAVYASFLSNDWACDDRGCIAGNNALRESGNVSRLFSKEYFVVSRESSYRPVSTFLYMAIYRVFGQSPFYFHLSSLLLHLLAVAGVYFLSLRLLGGPGAAFMASLVFGLHPANTEAVFCASFNKDLIVTAGAVWLMILRAGRSYRDRWEPSAFAAAALIYFLCLFAKETALIFILLLLAYDLTFRRDELNTRNAGYFTVSCFCWRRSMFL